MAIIRSAHDWRAANDPEFEGDEDEGESEWEEEDKGDEQPEEEGEETGEARGEDTREEWDDDENGAETRQEDVTVIKETEVTGREERMEVIKIGRGTGLGNPFPLGKTGHDKTDRVRKLSSGAHRRWLEAKDVKAEDMVTEARGSEEGGDLLEEEVRARGTDRESGMTGEQQSRKLLRKLDGRKRTARTIALCGEATCSRGEPNHADAMKEIAMGHLRATAITGDRANAAGEERGTEEGASANPTRDHEGGGEAMGGGGRRRGGRGLQGAVD